MSDSTPPNPQTQDGRDGAGRAPFDPVDVAPGVAKPPTVPPAMPDAPVVDEALLGATSWGGASDEEIDQAAGEPTPPPP